jgi:hypothetical protein
MQINGLLNKLKGAGGPEGGTQSPVANPFVGGGGPQAGVVNPFKPQVVPTRQDPGSELTEIASRGSAYSPDGGIGRAIPGGIHTPNGLAGKNLQVFA